MAPRSLCVALIISATSALRAPQRTQRGPAALRGKGFGDAPKPSKKKSRAASGPTISVDEDVEYGDASVVAPAAGGDSQDEIFNKFGIDSSGRTTTVAKAPEPSFEPLALVPPDVQVGIEKALLGTILALLVVFVGIGGFITYDAYCISTGAPEDPGLKAFIVDTLEPKFTPILGIGFACSILLGGFKTLQLTSDSAQYSNYSED